MKISWKDKFPKDYKYYETENGILNANRMPLRRHGLIAVFYEKVGKYFPQKWLKVSNHSRGTQVFTKEIKNSNYGYHKPLPTNSTNYKFPHSIIEIQKLHPSTSFHPTEKPIKLMAYLVKTYSSENDIVLDFTTGSGPTLVSSEILNRRWIGIEIEKKYCELIKHRIKTEIQCFVNIQKD